MLVVVVGKGHEVVPFALQINFAPKPRITLASVVPLAFRLSARIFFCFFGGGEIFLQFLRDILFAFAFRQRLTFRICRFEFSFYAVCLRIAFLTAFCLYGSESFLSGRRYNDCRHSKFCLLCMAWLVLLLFWF